MPTHWISTCNLICNDVMSVQRYHVYLRQSDRRWYPCLVVCDGSGLVAAFPAPKGESATPVTGRQLRTLRSFRGAERMRHKPAPPSGLVLGKWITPTPPCSTMMLSRPDVPGHKPRWA